jgi:hypothetical protein
VIESSRLEQASFADDFNAFLNTNGVDGEPAQIDGADIEAVTAPGGALYYVATYSVGMSLTNVTAEQFTASSAMQVSARQAAATACLVDLDQVIVSDVHARALPPGPTRRRLLGGLGEGVRLMLEIRVTHGESARVNSQFRLLVRSQSARDQFAATLNAFLAINDGSAGRIVLAAVDGHPVASGTGQRLPWNPTMGHIFCPQGYYRAAATKATHRRESYYLEGVGHETCRACPQGKTNDGGGATGCYVYSDEWKQCSHVGCKVLNAARFCKLHTAANPRVALQALPGEVPQKACQNRRHASGFSWPVAAADDHEEQRITVFHHGHEEVGTLHTCSVSDPGTHTCNCLCKAP